MDNPGSGHIGTGIGLGEREKVGSGGILFFLEGFFHEGLSTWGRGGTEPIAGVGRRREGRTRSLARKVTLRAF